LQVRDWLHVEDHCRAIDAIIHKGKIGETYCVGGNSEKTNMDIVKTILEILCRDESWIEHVEDRKGHDKRYAINFDKIKNELGWQSQVAFEDGIKKTVQWFIENESWWKNIKSGEYEKYYQEQYKK